MSGGAGDASEARNISSDNRSAPNNSVTALVDSSPAVLMFVPGRPATEWTMCNWTYQIKDLMHD